MKNTNHHDIDLSAIAREAMKRYGFEADFSSHALDEVKLLREDLLVKKGE